jgi:hypothetical protein
MRVALADSVVLIVVFGAYITPTLVALTRKVPNRGSVIVVNVLLGWTVIGWVVALAMACRSIPPAPPVTRVPPVQHQYGRHRA